MNFRVPETYTNSLLVKFWPTFPSIPKRLQIPVNMALLFIEAVPPNSKSSTPKNPNHKS